MGQELEPYLEYVLEDGTLKPDSDHPICEADIAFLIALVSALRKEPVAPRLVILGDLSIIGNVKSVYSLAEPLEIAMENGARRTPIPLEKRFLEVSREIIERVDPISFSDPLAACNKANGAV